MTWIEEAKKAVKEAQGWRIHSSSPVDMVVFTHAPRALELLEEAEKHVAYLACLSQMNGVKAAADAWLRKLRGEDNA